MSSAPGRPGRKRVSGGSAGHGGGSGERWLVSYADLITLLFALFVVLYASSQADLVKLKKVSEGLRKSLHAPAEAGARPATPGGPGGTSAENPDAGRATTVRDELHPFRDVEHGLQASVEAHEVSVQSGPDGIALTFTLGQIFPDGSVPQVPFSDRRGAIERVGRAVVASLRAHADQRLIIESRAHSFAHASARATWLAREWSARLGVDAARIELRSAVVAGDDARSVLRAILQGAPAGAGG